MLRKKGVIIIKTTAAFFLKRQSENHLHCASQFAIKSLVALDTPQWTASSANQLWALCCHCWPLNTAAGCRKTSALLQSQSHWSAAASCPAAAIQISTAAAVAVAPATTDQGLYLTAVTTVLFNILSFSSFLHLRPHMFAWAGFLISLCTCQIVHLSLTNLFSVMSIFFSPFLLFPFMLNVKMSLILCCYSFFPHCPCLFTSCHCSLLTIPIFLLCWLPCLSCSTSFSAGLFSCYLLISALFLFHSLPLPQFMSWLFFSQNVTMVYLFFIFNL